ncbi:hypothetical protein E2C01_024506 [Portunus trituberculatus]|uniref:Uncharacterized protein n=1 Tax=Portunus trituberculatus TaxID=210409 RepID=A0A5B7EAR6_PORTR|nr:hypothetical protein [Portunus trituberculatus]
MKPITFPQAASPCLLCVTDLKGSTTKPLRRCSSSVAAAHVRRDVRLLSPVAGLSKCMAFPGCN